MREEQERKVNGYGGMRGRGICLGGISEEKRRQAQERRGEAGRMHTYVEKGRKGVQMSWR